jgi:hypothetical protein
MTNPRRLRGIELRYVLTMELFNQGPTTITKLIEAVMSRGLDLGLPAPKSVSDALRWEIRHGRARRLGRGLYGPGYLPRGTERRIHKRVLALRAEVENRSKAGNSPSGFEW